MGERFTREPTDSGTPESVFSSLLGNAPPTHCPSCESMRAELIAPAAAATAASATMNVHSPPLMISHPAKAASTVAAPARPGT